MKLDNNEIYHFLITKGIHSLHHANSVATSLTFIQNGGLLSRQAIENKGLFQTRQLSDSDDKRNDVWNDIFFDSVDLHGFFPRQNLYGPVLFKFNSNILLQEDLQIYITKDNPMFWNKYTKVEDKYFVDMDDINNNWNKFQTQRKMITIRFQDNPIPFKDIESIILDDPRVIIYGDTEVFVESKTSLYDELARNEALKSLLQIRECSNPCFCRKNYLDDYGNKKLAKFFLPVTHSQFNNF